MPSAHARLPSTWTAVFAALATVDVLFLFWQPSPLAVGLFFALGVFATFFHWRDKARVCHEIRSSMVHIHLHDGGLHRGRFPSPFVRAGTHVGRDNRRHFDCAAVCMLATSRAVLWIVIQ